MSEDMNNAAQNWYDPLVGEDESRVELLSKYDTPDAFFESYNSAVNRDWRDDIAGDDDKFKSKLQRFTDPGAFGNAYREAEQKIRAGDIGPKVPGDGATEDEIKEYRRQIGIPLEADGYLKELPDGLVIGEQDKELVSEFISELHGANAPTPIVHKALSWYNNLQERMQEAEQQLDIEQARETTDVLRDAETGWGKDYRTNMNLIKGLLDSSFGKEVSGQLLNGRYQDGRGFMNDPNVLKGLAAIARKINPVGTIIDQDGDNMQSLHDEIKEIESKMGTQEYKKDEAMQARYRQLVSMRQTVESQNAA